MEQILFGFHIWEINKILVNKRSTFCTQFIWSVTLLLKLCFPKREKYLQFFSFLHLVKKYFYNSKIKIPSIIFSSKFNINESGWSSKKIMENTNILCFKYFSFETTVKTFEKLTKIYNFGWILPQIHCLAEDINCVTIERINHILKI